MDKLGRWLWWGLVVGVLAAGGAWADRSDERRGGGSWHSPSPIHGDRWGGGGGHGGGWGRPGPYFRVDLWPFPDYYYYPAPYPPVVVYTSPGPTVQAQAPPPAVQGRVMAEIVVGHVDPSRVVAQLGVVGDPWPPLTLVFQHGYDAIRNRWGARAEWDSRQDVACGVVDLGQYRQNLTGQHSWYLRLDDQTGPGGYLLSFAIRTSDALFQTQGVPLTFGPRRPTEVRLVPAFGSSVVPPPAEGPGVAIEVVARRLAPAALPAQHVVLEYRLNLPSNPPTTRLQLTEQLPSSDWQIARCDPAPSRIDLKKRQVSWDLASPASGSQITLELVVPDGRGWQEFRGGYRVNSGPVLGVGGDARFWIGDTPPAP